MVLKDRGSSLVVQWLRLRASTAGGAGSIPGRGTKIPACCVVWPKKEKKKKKKRWKERTYFNTNGKEAQREAEEPKSDGSWNLGRCGKGHPAGGPGFTQGRSHGKGPA